jgi:hypothetical protein
MCYNDGKVTTSLKQVNVKAAQSNFYKQLIKDNHMDEKIEKKKVGMGKVMCWKRIVASKT